MQILSLNSHYLCLSLWERQFKQSCALKTKTSIPIDFDISTGTNYTT